MLLDASILLINGEFTLTCYLTQNFGLDCVKRLIRARYSSFISGFNYPEVFI